MDKLSLSLYRTYSAFILWQLVCVTLAGQMDSRHVNHTQANTNCNDSGGLYQISQAWFGYIEDISPKTNIEDGQSAWINGYAKLSMIFTSWHGCYNVGKKIEARLQAGDSFYSCTEKCKGHRFMGTRNMKCVCLNVTDLSDLQVLADISCSNQDEPSEWTNNGNRVTCMSVYDILQGNSYTWDSNPQYQQCVAVRVHKDRSEFTTKYCYSNVTDVHGYMCTNSVSGPLNYHCSTSQFCILRNTTSWFNAKTQCSSYNGKLLLPTGHIDVNDNNTYWIGMFRSYKFVKYPNKFDACLSATKVESKLIIEPDNCANRKLPLCSNEQVMPRDETTTITNREQTKYSTNVQIIPRDETTTITNTTLLSQKEYSSVESLRTFTANDQLGNNLVTSMPHIVVERSSVTRITEFHHKPSNTENYSLYIIISLVAVTAAVLISALVKVVLTRRAHRCTSARNTKPSSSTSGIPLKDPLSENNMNIEIHDEAYDMVDLDRRPSSSTKKTDENHYDSIDQEGMNIMKAPVINTENVAYDLVNLERSPSSSIENPDQINQYDRIENRDENQYNRIDLKGTKTIEAPVINIYDQMRFKSTSENNLYDTVQLNESVER